MEKKSTTTFESNSFSSEEFETDSREHSDSKNLKNSTHLQSDSSSEESYERLEKLNTNRPTSPQRRRYSPTNTSANSYTNTYTRRPYNNFSNQNAYRRQNNGDFRKNDSTDQDHPQRVPRNFSHQNYEQNQPYRNSFVLSPFHRQPFKMFPQAPNTGIYKDKDSIAKAKESFKEMFKQQKEEADDIKAAVQMAQSLKSSQNKKDQQVKAGIEKSAKETDQEFKSIIERVEKEKKEATMDLQREKEEAKSIKEKRKDLDKAKKNNFKGAGGGKHQVNLFFNIGCVDDLVLFIPSDLGLAFEESTLLASKFPDLKQGNPRDLKSGECSDLVKEWEKFFYSGAEKNRILDPARMKEFLVNGPEKEEPSGAGFGFHRKSAAELKREKNELKMFETKGREGQISKIALSAMNRLTPENVLVTAKGLLDKLTEDEETKLKTAEELNSVVSSILSSALNMPKYAQQTAKLFACLHGRLEVQEAAFEDVGLEMLYSKFSKLVGPAEAKETPGKGSKGIFILLGHLFLQGVLPGAAIEDIQEQTFARVQSLIQTIREEKSKAGDVEKEKKDSSPLLSLLIEQSIIMLITLAMEVKANPSIKELIKIDVVKEIIDSYRALFSTDNADKFYFKYCDLCDYLDEKEATKRKSILPEAQPMSTLEVKPGVDKDRLNNEFCSWLGSEKDFTASKERIKGFELFGLLFKLIEDEGDKSRKRLLEFMKKTPGIFKHEFLVCAVLMAFYREDMTLDIPKYWELVSEMFNDVSKAVSDKASTWDRKKVLEDCNDFLLSEGFENVESSLENIIDETLKFATDKISLSIKKV